MPPTPDLVDTLTSIEATLATGEQPGTVEDRALQLATIERITTRLTELREAIIDSLVADMEEDTLQTPHGWLVRSKRDPSETWDNEGARRSARAAIIAKVATNRETGEVIPGHRMAINEALDWYEQTFSVGKPKAAFRTTFGFDVDEFRTTTPRGKTVKLVDPASLKP